MSAAPDFLGASNAMAREWIELSREITRVENSDPWHVQLPPAADRPVHYIGITGPPGAGKSTLTGAMIQTYVGQERRVAVLAVDPSSPTTGGAILGDRIRMERQLLGTKNIFVRSLASRGSHGALASATRNVARVCEASGLFDVIIIETVGAGQTEVAIAGLADTVVLVTVPGLGDVVQAMKAGLMEVADVLVVNMADRHGAAATARHLRLTLGREVPVLQTVAIEGSGIDKLVEKLDKRWVRLNVGDGLVQERRRKESREAVLIAQHWLARTSVDDKDDEVSHLRKRVGALLAHASTEWSELGD